MIAFALGVGVVAGQGRGAPGADAAARTPVAGYLPRPARPVRDDRGAGCGEPDDRVRRQRSRPDRGQLRRRRRPVPRFRRDPDGGYTTVDRPGAAETHLHKVNDRGQAVGTWWEAPASAPGAVRHGLLVDGDSLHTIDVPGSVATDAQDVSDHGHVVGAYAAMDGTIHGFVRDPRGRYTTVDAPGAIGTVLNGVNNRGEVVGTAFTTPTTVRAFLLAAGQFSWYALPGAPPMLLNGIYDRGQLVGTADARAFLLAADLAGPCAAVDHPAASRTIAYDINNSGLIVGPYENR